MSSNSLFTVSTAQGDSYHLCADATKVDNYRSILPKDKARFLLADPPYCLLTRRNKKTGQKRDAKKSKINHSAVTRFENIKEYRIFTRKWLSAAVEFLTDDANICIWTNFLGKAPIKEELAKLGEFHFLGEFKWCKLTKEVNSGNEITGRFYEVGLIFSRQSPPNVKSSDLPTVWSVVTTYDQEKEGNLWGNHPNHKSFSVLEPLIRQYSQVGDRILDPFSGSGSTPAAALRLERTVSALELRIEWARVSQQRMQAIVKNSKL